jgi:transcriptional regulator with XRE-family HTH domain
MERNIRLNWQNLVKEAVRRRKEQGLTQKQLAVLVDVSGPTVNSFEQSSDNITLDSCFKILRFLGLLEELPELFEQYLPKDKKLNEFYANIKNSGDHVEQIEQAYKRCKPYLDKDFKKLFPLKDAFFPRLWELFVCERLLLNGLEDYLRASKGKGPDFVLENYYEGKNLYIECVCPQEATEEKIENKSFVREEEKVGNLISAKETEEDESIIARYTNSLAAKAKKFEEKYSYTLDHYKVLCVSSAELDILKTKRHNSESFLSTKRDFEASIFGNRTNWFGKDGKSGVEDKTVNIQKGENLLQAGQQSYLSIFDAIIFSGYLPFLTYGTNEDFIIFNNQATPKDLVKKLENAFRKP